MPGSYHSPWDLPFLPSPTPWTCSHMFHQTMRDIYNSRIWVHMVKQGANNAQFTTTSNMYKLNSSFFFCKKCCEKICKPHLQHIKQEVKTSKAQEKTREWANLNLFYFQKCPFWAYIFQKLAHSLFGAWSFFMVHIRCTPSEGPKAFKFCFFKEVGQWKLDHELRLLKKALFHGPTSWSIV